VRHGIAPPNLTVSAGWLPIAAAVGGGVIAALLAVLAAGRRAARVPPSNALTEAAVEPRLLGPGRVIGGLLGLAGASDLGDDGAIPSGGGRLPRADRARVAAGVLGPPVARLSPVGGFLASANLRTATRRFSSASTPLMLTVGLRRVRAGA
jgi:putative ABC transport system permease protein